MSKGGSYGGGKSSLGYLFGSENTKTPPSISVKDNKPPQNNENKYSTSSLPSSKQHISNNYHRAQGQNTGNFITDRPTTKVQSVPGGDSSVGYLFGGK